jgi:hypothetical protein
MGSDASHSRHGKSDSLRRDCSRLIGFRCSARTSLSDNAARYSSGRKSNSSSSSERTAAIVAVEGGEENEVALRDLRHIPNLATAWKIRARLLGQFWQIDHGMHVSTGIRSCSVQDCAGCSSPR